MYRVESPRADDTAIEREIVAKGKTGARVTPADIEANIACEFSFTVGNAARALNCPVSESADLLTISVLTLKNGFTVTGESACASPENFDAEIGNKIARANAVNKIWPLLGFRLRDRLCAENHAASFIDGQWPGSGPI